MQFDPVRYRVFCQPVLEILVDCCQHLQMGHLLVSTIGPTGNVKAVLTCEKWRVAAPCSLYETFFDA